MDNKSIFKNELNMITNEVYRDFISRCLDNVPSYFWTIPASSSGKYHPQADLGEGGLVRHAKSCVQVGLDLLRSEVFVEDNNRNKDIMIGALLLHDTFKNGQENGGHTEFLHPYYAFDYVVYSYCTYGKPSEELFNYSDIVASCIFSHMGKWNTHKDYFEDLPLPKTELGKLVHMADYIASRKYCNMNDIELFKEV